MRAAGPIVIAEDDRTMVKVLWAVLREVGRDVHVATDGDEAVELVRSLNPALLILDMHMPFRSGVEVLKVVRAEGVGAGMKILVLTAQAQRDVEDRIRELGADEYMVKPIHIAALLAQVRRLLGETGPA